MEANIPRFVECPGELFVGVPVCGAFVVYPCIVSLSNDAGVKLRTSSAHLECDTAVQCPNCRDFGYLTFRSDYDVPPKARSAHGLPPVEVGLLQAAVLPPMPVTVTVTVAR